MSRPWRARSFRVAATAAAIAALLLGCATATPPTSPGPADDDSPAPTVAVPSPATATLPAFDAVGVSLGIYSGRPDPSWTLTDAHAAELRRIVDGLPMATIEPASGGLGYHGFTVTLEGPGADPRTIVAYRGQVAEAGTGPRPTWLDPDGRVERFLLATGGAALSPAEVQAVAADLDAQVGRAVSPSPSS